MREDTLTIGSFNLKFGRDKDKVAREVKTLFEKHDMDALAVQEARDYFSVLHDLPGVEYICDDSLEGGRHQGYLVSPRHARESRASLFAKTYGDGWVTVTKKFHVPMVFPRINVDWLRLGNVHMMTPIKWGDADRERGQRDRPVGPPERVDDYVTCARAVLRFMCRRGPRAVVGDWNEPPHVHGYLSPAWVAEHSGSYLRSPKSKAGHGRIDYMMASNEVEILETFKDLEIAEDSDHEPVVTVVRRARQ